MNIVIIDGVVATTIPQSWQSEAEQIQALERENADLRLQLETKVQLRTKLNDALEKFALNHPERFRHQIDFESACAALVFNYHAARDGGAI